MRFIYERALVWFRRDLRVTDHAALYQACLQARQVYCVFVFDTALLAPLPRSDRRVEFIHGSIKALDKALQEFQPQAGLIVLQGLATELIEPLTVSLKIDAVFVNHDDEPIALSRDKSVHQALTRTGIAWHSSKDHVIFERNEILTSAQKPYSVFTPYKNAWLNRFALSPILPYAVENLSQRLASRPNVYEQIPTLLNIGFEPSNLSSLGVIPGEAGAKARLADFIERIDQYATQRDFPALKGPSYLSVHLRFGTISVRHLVQMAWSKSQQGSHGASIWLAELIWRDFYHQILYHHPHVVGHSFKPAYDQIQWEQGAHASALFEAWCQGQTGYPLVDAAMHQLNFSGYMHNRLRMVTASFLIKDLGIDWRWGETYFARQLIDFDLAANNGGWQWAASSGCDAQPYFRIFNPITQSEKFDAQGRFIRRYLVALQGLSDKTIHAPWLAKAQELEAAGVTIGQHYPAPLIDHQQARAQTMARYAVVKSSLEPSNTNS